MPRYNDDIRQELEQRRERLRAAVRHWDRARVEWIRRGADVNEWQSTVGIRADEYGEIWAQIRELNRLLYEDDHAA